MLLQKVKKICKRDGIVIVNRENGEQWLGAPGAIYPVFGIGLCERTVCTLFDFPEDDENRTYIELPESELASDGVTLDNLPEDGSVEEPLAPLCWTLGLGGRSFVTLCGARKTDLVLLADADNTAPLKDCEDLRFYARQDVLGDWYIIAKSGFVVVGVMAAEKIPDSAFAALNLVSANVVSVGDVRYARGTLFKDAAGGAK